MGTFFAYSIQSSICLALFYLFYRVLLSRETFHRFNRIGLLGILFLSFILPYVFTLFSFLNQTPILIEPEMHKLSGDKPSDIAGKETGNVYASLLLIVYISGCFIYLIYQILTTIRIGRLINKGAEFTNVYGIKTILIDDTTISPFSWMRYIVLSKSDFEAAGDVIIAHESAHIRLHHSYDLIIAQICIFTQWFNPAAWLLYRELQSIHEYEADDAVISAGIDAKQYQLLLIKKAVGTRLYSMSNSLNHSNLIKRITMMYQKKSNPWARLKYAYVLPLAATTVALFARPEISQPFAEISNAKVSHFALDLSKLPLTSEFSGEKEAKWQVPKDSIYDTCEISPEFPGGREAMAKWLISNLVYPTKSIENGIQGTVFCTFVVGKNGAISNVEVTKGVNQELDEEAVRAIKTSPKWKPGQHAGKPVYVRFTLPVIFILTAKE